MGSALIQAIENKPKPKIALLNIGVEEIKGNDQVKRTAHMLAESTLMNYVGYVEEITFIQAKSILWYVMVLLGTWH